jgi:hypothetical protein
MFTSLRLFLPPLMVVRQFFGQDPLPQTPRAVKLAKGEFDSATGSL